MKAQGGRIDQPIARSDRDRKKMAVKADGRPSVTQWTLLENLRGAALLDVHILTGRTHQIRVHMQSIGHPVAGDPLYGLKHGVTTPRLLLHAHTLCFDHPRTGERMQLEAPVPDVFTQTVAKLRG
jgi:23S rRNA pseudouridine1911/1915/1917 synthase